MLPVQNSQKCSKGEFLSSDLRLCCMVAGLQIGLQCLQGGQVNHSGGIKPNSQFTAQDDDKSDQNDYYNGNSTEFRGDN